MPQNSFSKLRRANISKGMCKALGKPIDPTARFWTYVKIEDLVGCWIWNGNHIQNGYGQLRWKEKTTLAHRAAWEIVKGPIPEGLWVLHKCDVRDCVNPNHLFLGTRLNNMQDAGRKGRMRRGEANHLSVLTTKQVRRIKKLINEKMPLKKIAKEFGITPSAISAIKCKRSWRHIEI